MANIWDAVMNWLSYKDRTIAETKSWLIGKGFGEDEISDTIAELQKLSYIDDYRYAESYAAMAKEKSWSERKLKQELVRKGIEEETVKEVLEHFGDEISEKEVLRGVAKKLIKKDISTWERIWEYGKGNKELFQSKEEYFKEKQKCKARLGRQLCSRGFNFDVVKAVLEEITKGVGIER